MYLTDLIVAETVHVLESYYEAPREQVATAMLSLVSMRSAVTVDPALLFRAIEIRAMEARRDGWPQRRRALSLHPSDGKEDRWRSQRE